MKNENVVGEDDDVFLNLTLTPITIFTLNFGKVLVLCS
jgi:hypothetical protein